MAKSLYHLCCEKCSNVEINNISKLLMSSITKLVIKIFFAEISGSTGVAESRFPFSRQLIAEVVNIGGIVKLLNQGLRDSDPNP